MLFDDKGCQESLKESLMTDNTDSPSHEPDSKNTGMEEDTDIPEGRFYNPAAQVNFHY